MSEWGYTGTRPSHGHPPGYVTVPCHGRLCTAFPLCCQYGEQSDHSGAVHLTSRRATGQVQGQWEARQGGWGVQRDLVDHVGAMALSDPPVSGGELTASEVGRSGGMGVQQAKRHRVRPYPTVDTMRGQCKVSPGGNGGRGRAVPSVWCDHG